MQTATLLKSKVKTKLAIAAGDLNDDPPAAANMVDLSEWINLAAPLTVEAVLVGSEAADLTDGWWYGYSAELTLPVRLVPVNKGDAVEVRATAGVAVDLLDMVAGVYTHVGIGEATLSAGTLSIYLRPIEVQR